MTTFLFPILSSGRFILSGSDSAGHRLQAGAHSAPPKSFCLTGTSFVKNHIPTVDYIPCRSFPKDSCREKVLTGNILWPHPYIMYFLQRVTSFPVCLGNTDVSFSISISPGFQEPPVCTIPFGLWQSIKFHILEYFSKLVNSLILS